MIPEGLAYGIFFVCFVCAIPCVMLALVEKHPIAIICLPITVAGAVMMLIASHNASERVRALPATYFAVQEIGSAESPIDIAVVKSQTFNITERMHVVLYNPELYYLEVQRYTTSCDGWCLVTVEKQPSYRVVPRSLVEVQ